MFEIMSLLYWTSLEPSALYNIVDKYTKRSLPVSELLCLVLYTSNGPVFQMRHLSLLLMLQLSSARLVNRCGIRGGEVELDTLLCNHGERRYSKEWTLQTCVMLVTAFFCNTWDNGNWRKAAVWYDNNLRCFEFGQSIKNGVI